MMAENLALPLHLSNQQPRKEGSLQSRILQIHSQKGAFRYVTEASLLEEIRSQKQHDADTTMADVEDVEAEQPERFQTISKSREDMMQQLRRAQNDTLMTLDFVSLLLSKFAPTTAESTMSPALKDSVPIGTLETRLMKYISPTVSEASLAQSLYRAYKVQGFTKAADKLVGAASRLEDEAAKEARYWEQVLSIKERGWAISKMRRDPRTLAVHFGFRDAAPFYRNRGLAALRRNADGSLRLDHGAVPPRPVTLDVSVIRDGKRCGYSPMTSPSALNDVNIEEEILQARNTLFNEELFQELGREARLLANLGATMSMQCIDVPLGEKATLRLQLIESGHNTAEDASSAGPDQQLAEAISIALQILLCHAHEQILRRRSQPPPPMTLEPKSNPEYLLIRPILAHIKHRSDLNDVTTYLESLVRPLSTAGIPITLQTIPMSQSLLSPFTTLTQISPTSLLTSLMKPLNTPLTLHLPTGHTVAVTVHTNLNPPTFGTIYTFNPPAHTYSSLATTISLPHVNTGTELHQHLQHLITVDLSVFITSNANNKPSTQLPAEPQSPHQDQPLQRDLAPKDQNRATEPTEDDETIHRWHILDPHLGSLARARHDNRRHEKISLRIRPERLGLLYVTMTRQSQQSQREKPGLVPANETEAEAELEMANGDVDGGGGGGVDDHGGGGDGATVTTTQRYLWTGDGKVKRRIGMEKGEMTAAAAGDEEQDQEDNGQGDEGVIDETRKALLDVILTA